MNWKSIDRSILRGLVPPGGYLGPLFAFAAICALALVSCRNDGSHDNEGAVQRVYGEGSFRYDLDFLKQYDSVVVLQGGQDGAALIVSPKFQGKVFTSTAQGDSGYSFGWINYKAFAAAVDSHMNAYGGENRLWLGPEGGTFSLFFPKGKSMIFQNWKTPAPFDTESWKVSDKNERTVTLHKDMRLTNYSGTDLSLDIDRTITILDRAVIDSLLHTPPDTAIRAVGYQTINVLTNTGSHDWTFATGMPCIWILDMFRPSSSAVIIVPYQPKAPKQDRLARGEATIPGHHQSTTTASPAGRVATTDYFGKIPSDRLVMKDSILLYRADGKSRGKLGIYPPRAKPVAGSYDPENKVLTIIVFDIDPGGKYLNQEWTTDKPPFSGDAVNAYNDGPLADGTQMGPFYELESVSPAALLHPKDTLVHRHAVFHFTGSEAKLDGISKQVLGISLEAVKKAF